MGGYSSRLPSRGGAGGADPPGPLLYMAAPYIMATMKTTLDLLTLRDAARYLGVTPATVARRVRLGQLIPAVRTSSSFFFTLEALDDPPGADSAQLQRRLVTSTDAARRIGVTVSTLHGWVRRGRVTPALPGRPGRTALFWADDVTELAAAWKVLGRAVPGAGKGLNSS